MTIDQLFISAFLAHFAWVVMLYCWLTFERARAVREGQVQIGDFVKVGADPGRAHRVQRNLSNQFEAPVFALFAALFIWFSDAVTWIDVAAAWTFFAGRVIHTGVQTLTTNVPLRGLVFVINFLGVLALMARVAWIALTGQSAG